MIVGQNKGMKHYRDLELFVNQATSCPFELDKDQRGGIRVNITQNQIDVSVKQANGDASYTNCRLMPKYHSFQPFLTITAQNTKETLNEIDLDAIFVKNADLKAPYTPESVKAERSTGHSASPMSVP